MLTLVFDTETTGKADFKAAKLNRLHCQPYIVQLGAILYEDQQVVAELNLIVDPSYKGTRVEVPQEAIDVHGISNEMIEAASFDHKVVIPMFNQLVRKADRLVAHNMQFDLLMARSMFTRIAASHDTLLGVPKVCTMLSAKPVLKLPGKYGDYKWPSLDEAYRTLVDADGFEGAHDAMVDVRAAAAVLFALEDAGHPLTH